MNMKKFDRILNIALVIALILFVVDTVFIKETPESFDSDKKSDFAAVELSKQAESAVPDTADMPETGVGGPEVGEPEPFTALSWEQMEAAVSGDAPTIMLVFTSWCPFCKKLFPEIVSLSAERGDRLNVVAISIDEDPNAIRTYISSLPTMPSFPVYSHATDNERSLIQAFLYRNKLNFSGGIPYMAIFKKGKAVQQIGGFVEKKVLTDMLDALEKQEK